MSEKTLDVQFAAVAQFEFYSSNESDSIESAFEELYGDSGDTHGGPIMGAGGYWQRTIFSKEEDLPEELSQFENVRTYLTPDERHVHDAITVGRLDPETVEEMLSVDRRRAEGVVDAAMESLNGFTEQIPTIPEVDSIDVPTVFYVEPEERLDIGWGDDGLDLEVTSQWLDAHQGQLQRIKILLGQPISLVGTEDFIAPQSFGEGYIRQVTILNTSATHDDSGGTDVMGPLWLRRVEGAIKSYYRADYWLNYRRRQIGEIDDQTHGIDGVLEGNGESLEEYQSVEEELESLRKSWVDQYTLIRDELADLGENFQFEDNTESAPEYEIPIPLPESEQTPVSIYENYEDHLAELFEVARDDMDRIGDKLDRLSQFIHDSVTARTAASNVELQTEVKDLTRVLTWLTVLLAIFGVIQIGMTL